MRNKKGQVLVEVALILPFLLILAFGIIDFGRYMYTKNTLNNAASSGVRMAAVTRPLTTVTGVSLTSPITTEPGRTIQSCLFNGIDANSVTYDLNFFNNGVQIATGTEAQTGNMVKVTVTLPVLEMLSPFKFGIYADTLKVTGEAAMRYE